MQAINQIADIVVAFPLTQVNLEKAINSWMPEMAGKEVFQTPLEDPKGIELARTIREFLIASSNSIRGRVVIVADAADLTLPAQQALLKTIEEHPKDTAIGLFTSRIDALIPTIVSRCVVHHVSSDDPTQISIQTLLSLPVAARITKLQGHTRSQLTTLCMHWLRELELVLEKSTDTTSYQAALVTSYALSMLSHQVSPEHVATTLCLRLPSSTR